MQKSKVTTFENVRFCYGEVCALKGADFTIPMYGLIAIVGPNGGGKSTLLKLMAEILSPTHGRIERNKKLKIGYVSQQIDADRMFPITVKQVVLSGTLGKKIRPFFHYKKLNEDKANEAVRSVGLSGFENRGIHQLSGGQLERLMIARALASDADVILLDEPDSSLDLDAAKGLYDMFKQLKMKKTLLVVSHRIEQILEIADMALYVNRKVDVYKDPTALSPELKGGITR